MKTALIAIEGCVSRRVLKNTLARQGWQVDALNSVEGALAFIDRSPPDVVLVDWEIGAGSGLALLRAIKNQPSWQAVPVVMMHGSVTREHLDEALKLGANDFLPVSFTRAEALRTMERWVLDQSDHALRFDP